MFTLPLGARASCPRVPDGVGPALAPRGAWYPKCEQVRLSYTLKRVMCLYIHHCASLKKFWCAGSGRLHVVATQNIALTLACSLRVRQPGRDSSPPDSSPKTKSFGERKGTDRAAAGETHAGDERPYTACSKHEHAERSRRNGMISVMSQMNDH